MKDEPLEEADVTLDSQYQDAVVDAWILRYINQSKGVTPRVLHQSMMILSWSLL